MVTALVLDLAGVFAFALNGGLTAVRVARVDIVGVITLAGITALGGGIVRDVLLGDVPPATFADWRYLVVATVGGLAAFALSDRLDRFSLSINLFDALGLSLFAVTGTAKALEYGLGPMQAVLLGGITAVGGGTIRDVLVRRVPTVLQSELYAIPALAGAVVVVVSAALGAPALVGALLGAGLCLAVRVLGIVLGLDAPRPRRAE